MKEYILRGYPRMYGQHPIGELVRCKYCEHYKDSEVEDRKMCFRKDADGMPVCYDFKPDDWCSYGERKEE